MLCKYKQYLSCANEPSVLHKYWCKVKTSAFITHCRISTKWYQLARLIIHHQYGVTIYTVNYCRSRLCRLLPFTVQYINLMSKERDSISNFYNSYFLKSFDQLFFYEHHEMKHHTFQRSSSQSEWKAKLSISTCNIPHLTATLAFKPQWDHMTAEYTQLVFDEWHVLLFNQLWSAA